MSLQESRQVSRWDTARTDGRSHGVCPRYPSRPVPSRPVFNPPWSSERSELGPLAQSHLSPLPLTKPRDRGVKN
jgi:hypothetical protein